MVMQHWEHFEHEADIGLRGFGDTPAAAFEQVALAMTAVITTIEQVQPVTTIAVTCEGASLDLLLFDWLNRLIYEMATRRLLFCRFDVRIEGKRLTGSATGERVNPQRHAPAVEIKAATFHQLRVCENADHLWVAQCVVDV